MDRFCYELARFCAEHLPFEEPIVALSSLVVPGQEQVSDVKAFFPGKEFIGCDMQQGEGVDRIENIEDMSFEDDSVGSFISLNTFEHVWDVFAAAREINRVVRPGGTILVSSVFNFHIHHYPSDYWRFTPVAWRKFFPDCRSFVTGQQGHVTTPRVTFGVGRLGDAPFPAESLEDMQLTLERDGVTEPPGTFDKLRARVGYHLLKKRAFRDMIHADQVRLWLHDGDAVVAEAGTQR